MFEVKKITLDRMIGRVYIAEENISELEDM